MQQIHRTLYVTGLLAWLVILASSCTKPPATQQEISQMDVEHIQPTTDTLVYAGDFSQIRSLDPAEAYEMDSFQIVGNMYETLVVLDTSLSDDQMIKPVLAKEWTIEEHDDHWTMTFRLNEKARFASGRPVTAQDVVYSWGRVIDRNGLPAFLFTDIVQLKKENLHIVDSQTLAVTLPNTTNPQIFMAVLSFSAAAVLDHEVVTANAGNDQGVTWLTQHSAGSGPYMLARWEPGKSIVLIANPNYWNETPSIKTVVLRSVSDEATLSTLIDSGAADIIKDISNEQVRTLSQNPDVLIERAYSLDFVYLGMNVDKPPFDRQEVREAIRFALNYDKLTNQLIDGNGIIVQEIIPVGLPGHTGLQPFLQDREKAQKLLNEAGFQDGTPIELLTYEGIAPGGALWADVAALIKRDLDAVGFDVQITQSPDMLDRYRAKESQMVLAVWGPDFFDPDTNVTSFTVYDAQSIAWRNNWNDPELAKLAKSAAEERDMASRMDLYRTITEKVLHTGPYAILYQPRCLFARRAHVKGFLYVPTDTPMIRFDLIHKE